MSPSAPPASAPRKRPWYLVVALVIASVFGATSFLEGCGLLTYYRTTSVDLSGPVREIDDEADRAAAQAALDHYVEALDQDKPRMFPLGAAELLLGLALFALAAGAMAGRSGARTALVQVVLVQSVVVVLMFFLGARVRAANRDLELVKRGHDMRKDGTDAALVDDTISMTKKIAPVIEYGTLGARTLVAVLVLVALTRKRSRAYFEQTTNEV